MDTMTTVWAVGAAATMAGAAWIERYDDGPRVHWAAALTVAMGWPLALPVMAILAWRRS